MVLCAGELSASGEDTLVNEGWSVLHVDVVQNPGRWDAGGTQTTAPFPSRFWAVYTKLAIFNMVQYSKGTFSSSEAMEVSLAAKSKPVCFARISHMRQRSRRSPLVLADQVVFPMKHAKLVNHELELPLSIRFHTRD